MRFLVDECAPVYTTNLLRAQGHDVFDPRDAKMRGAEDETLLRIAAQEERIIITRDLDFNLMFFKNLKPSGLILLRYPNALSPRTVTRLFEAFIASGGLERSLGMIVVLTPGGARFRPLGK